MKQYAYFNLNNDNGKPVGVVCLAESYDGYVAFGLSLKSKQDRFKFGYGRKLAHERAAAALKVEYNHDIFIIRGEAIQNLKDLSNNSFKKVMNLFSALGCEPTKCAFGFETYDKVVKIFTN
jgi:hypothetical protein